MIKIRGKQQADAVGHRVKRSLLTLVVAMFSLRNRVMLRSAKTILARQRRLCPLQGQQRRLDRPPVTSRLFRDADGFVVTSNLGNGSQGDVRRRCGRRPFWARTARNKGGGNPSIRVISKAP